MTFSGENAPDWSGGPEPPVSRGAAVRHNMSALAAMAQSFHWPGRYGNVQFICNGESKMVGALAENLTQAVPFFHVRDMSASLRFYRDGLGFDLKLKWTPDAPDRIRWCQLEAGAVVLMLQEYVSGLRPSGELGQGVSVSFMCRDALAVYRDAVAGGLSPRRPFVGNGLWVVSFRDPDGYNIDFASPTDVPEEIEYDPDVHA